MRRRKLSLALSHAGRQGCQIHLRLWTSIQMTWPLFLRLSVCQSDRSNLSEEDNANRPTFLSLFYQRPNTTTPIKTKGAAKNVWSAKSSQGFWDFCRSFFYFATIDLQIKSKVAVNMKWRRHAVAFVDVSNWTRTICRAAGETDTG